MEEARRLKEMAYFAKLLKGRSFPTQAVYTRDLGLVRLNLQ